MLAARQAMENGLRRLLVACCSDMAAEPRLAQMIPGAASCIPLQHPTFISPG
ncbi:hypothetical protein CPter291_0307 [Collimonas pratensis]|uniref:Uncharacterized protein n=1 Tax=Collimonas pratensis TaxID=279113 RepID=A0ABN4M3L5_9BURK|nr:hypothetical protein CPter291_0307 [Collimonas pratensis]